MSGLEIRAKKCNQMFWRSGGCKGGWKEEVGGWWVVDGFWKRNRHNS